MREYRIKKGHNPDIGALVTKYFNVKGDIYKGMEFNVDGIGRINMKHDKNILFVDIEPPKKPSGDYSIIRKWNDFLYEATGFTSKERKKDLSKVK